MRSISSLALPWLNAFTIWHDTGSKNWICKLLREGEPLSRENGILLAAIVSGEWERPKIINGGCHEPFPDGIYAEFIRCRVMRLKDRIARESRRKKGLQNPEPYGAALEAIAPRYGLSPDGLDKRIRKTRYKKKTLPARKLFTDAMKEILAKSR